MVSQSDNLDQGRITFDFCRAHLKATQAPGKHPVTSDGHCRKLLLRSSAKEQAENHRGEHSRDYCKKNNTLAWAAKAAAGLLALPDSSSSPQHYNSGHFPVLFAVRRSPDAY
ncbi:hypothetical protein ABVK25_005083 [Lepraria finkii]|uniref:Uncharacterized protein n=1 Tax=Lepraria finkii TaxID=1340010 RepID=A0ABR4BA96_9LECA